MTKRLENGYYNSVWQEATLLRQAAFLTPRCQ